MTGDWGLKDTAASSQPYQSQDELNTDPVVTSLCIWFQSRPQICFWFAFWFFFVVFFFFFSVKPPNV